MSMILALIMFIVLITIAVDDILDIHKYLMKKNGVVKMFRFIKIMLVIAMSIFSCNALTFVSMINQECKARPQVVSISSDNPFFYPYSIEVNKCSGNCNNINDPYSKLCVPNVVENINVKVFNLVSRTDEARQTEWHKT